MASLVIMLQFLLISLSLPKKTIMKNIPSEVQSDIAAGKALFEEALNEGPRDENYERILESLEDAVINIDEEKKTADRYLFNHAEFIDACEHIVEDQLSALRKDKLSLAEFSTRFNRWFVFCDAVVNLGISCLYSKDSLKDKDYDKVFKTLKLNKNFETTMLKPRGIKVEFRHKSKQIMDKYPWLAMPVLIIRDHNGVEHQIAITPSPNARVWWLDVLASFHGSYNWVMTEPYEVDDDDGEEEVSTIENAARFGSADTAIEQPVDYEREPIVQKHQSWWRRLLNKLWNAISG